jgi:chromate transporter
MAPRDSALSVLLIFLRLGLTCFGGPIAHLGYFRAEFVAKRRWMGEDEFADLVALCQFLPGPASSQTGFAIGVSRAGLLGGLAAWTGFTLPSAMAMFAFAQVAASLSGPVAVAALHGLKIVAVAVVAQAVWGMAKTLTPDARRGGIALLAALIVLFAGNAPAQVGAIAMGALAGLALCRDIPVQARGSLHFALSRRFAAAMLLVFAGCLIALPFAAKHDHGAAVFEAFYRSGALVFGGGHVVLPLLRASVVTPGWMSDGTFLAGYGAAQAVPGPLFTIATFLGASLTTWPNGAAGAALATVAIFLPGMLILLGALPFWDRLRLRADAQAVMRGVNAAVVGILGAALYDPLWTSAILSPRDFAIALAGFVALVAWKAPPWSVVLLTVGAAVALSAAPM